MEELIGNANSVDYQRFVVTVMNTLFTGRSRERILDALDTNKVSIAGFLVADWLKEAASENSTVMEYLSALLATHGTNVEHTTEACRQLIFSCRVSELISSRR